LRARTGVGDGLWRVDTCANSCVRRRFVLSDRYLTYQPDPDSKDIYGKIDVKQITDIVNGDDDVVCRLPCLSFAQCSSPSALRRSIARSTSAQTTPSPRQCGSGSCATSSTSTTRSSVGGGCGSFVCLCGSRHVLLSCPLLMLQGRLFIALPYDARHEEACFTVGGTID
jgi:hypothetical protein